MPYGSPDRRAAPAGGGRLRRPRRRPLRAGGRRRAWSAASAVARDRRRAAAAWPSSAAARSARRCCPAWSAVVVPTGCSSASAAPSGRAQLAERYGVPAVDLADAAARARVLLLAVKPQDIDTLLGLLAEVVDDGHLVVSVAAGVPTARIEAALPAGVPVVRVMPNTPALVDEGMSVLSAGAHAGEAAPGRGGGPAGRRRARCGGCRRAQQDAVTALSGSGPAYFFYLVEAMVDAGILLGPAAGAGRRPDRADRPGRRGDDARLRGAPGAAARGGLQPGGHDGRRDPGAGAARRPGGAHGAIEAAHARSVELGARAGPDRTRGGRGPSAAGATASRAP